MIIEPGSTVGVAAGAGVFVAAGVSVAIGVEDVVGVGVAADAEAPKHTATPMSAAAEKAARGRFIAHPYMWERPSGNSVNRELSPSRPIEPQRAPRRPPRPFDPRHDP